VRVENAVRDFIRNGYYLGFIDVKEDESFEINHSIQQKLEEKLKLLEAEEEKEDNVSQQQCPTTPRTPKKRIRNQSSKK
jgi:hypothetical protein